MFIGHYAPALALRPVEPKVPLWALFVSVQLLDFGWDLFVLTGVEHVRITPGFTASNDLDLYDMPYTHSLAAALVWSIAAALVTLRLVPGSRRAAWVVGAAVLSHWLTDALVHVNDLSIAGGSTPRIGLGLWNHPMMEISVEIGTVIAAGAYAAWARAKTGVPTRPMLMLTALLVLVAVVERLVPPPASTTQLALSAFGAYVLFALAARRVDRTEAK